MRCDIGSRGASGSLGGQPRMAPYVMGIGARGRGNRCRRGLGLAILKLPNARRQPSPLADVGWTHLLGRVTRMNPHSYPRLDLR